jgi:hypothetical protein
MPRLRSALLALLLCVIPAQLHAQDRLPERRELFLALNAVVSGVYAAVGAATRDDGDVLAAFAQGAVGGAVTWSGQRLIGDGRPAFRLPGVQVAALGANLTRNAARGVPAFSDLILPVYPVYLRIRPGAEDPFSVRVSGLAVASLAWASLGADRFRADLDWRESLFTGGPVFRSSVSHLYPSGPLPSASCFNGNGCDDAVAGIHWLGTSIYTTGGRSEAASRRIIAHETIHLTQVHRDAILFGVPASDALFAHMEGPFAWIGEVFVIDAFLPMTGLNHALACTLPHHGGESWRLYEFEARAHAGR